MNTKLYVGNLSWSVTNEDLAKFFSQVGRVRMASVILNRETGRSRGFGFVEMETSLEAENAIRDLHDKYLGDRRIIVKEALPEGHFNGADALWGQISRFLREAVEDQQYEFMVDNKFFLLVRKGNRNGAPGRRPYR